MLARDPDQIVGPPGGRPSYAVTSSSWSSLGNLSSRAVIGSTMSDVESWRTQDYVKNTNPEIASLTMSMASAKPLDYVRLDIEKKDCPSIFVMQASSMRNCSRSDLLSRANAKIYKSNTESVYSENADSQIHQDVRSVRNNRQMRTQPCHEWNGILGLRDVTDKKNSKK
ncbi:hypothetical protein EVAR_43773_1 [Eumeta japonica]|uniref:Uncharacterized protein n=1 Tax=Eumeta variegata TaxID=151549 RepID=A0A4C1XKI1_EUMVA|nr:hypothetical protein EVAR_43773_1 [Eumeta japonica]